MAKNATAEKVEKVTIKTGLTEAQSAEAKTKLNAAIDAALKANYSTNSFECPLPVKDGYSGKCTGFGQRVWETANGKGQILFASINVDGKIVKVNFTDAVYFKSLGIGSTVVFNVALNNRNERTAKPVTGTAEVTKSK